jgi:hypothetical protein
MQNTSEIKEKILRIFRIKGPSLPVHIAKEINQSILFTSAFLSELLSEKKLKITSLRVGNSPVYFLSGQESQLEKYSEHIKRKEKEAYLLLKEKKFLKDTEQLPAIRVALRSIKDFAIPFKKNNKVYWRYFNVPEKGFIESTPQKKVFPSTESHHKIIAKPDLKQPIASRASLDIFDKKLSKKKPTEKAIRKKTTQKTNEKFFNKVKEFLVKKSIEITGIEGFSKKDLVLKIKKDGEEKLLIAHNKKRLTESDIINAHKKASEERIEYILLSLGEPLKKMTSLIEAIKNLDKIEKIE